jgi:hypothetical protein
VPASVFTEGQIIESDGDIIAEDVPIITPNGDVIVESLSLKVLTLVKTVLDYSHHAFPCSDYARNARAYHWTERLWKVIVFSHCARSLADIFRSS